MVASSSGSRAGSARTVLGALALLLLAASANAQFKPVAGREYREYHNPVNPVRGEAVIGLAIAPSEAAQRTSVVQVFLPQPYSGEIQIETATADGRFRGEGVFSGSSKGKEWVSFVLDSPARTDAKGAASRPVSPTSLAIVARGASGAIYLVRWGDSAPTGTSERLRLYVNSRRADMFVRGGGRAVRCMPAGASQPVRFDTYCDLPLAEVPADGQISLIRRDQFDEQTQAFKVLVP